MARNSNPIHLIYSIIDKNSSQKFFSNKEPNVENPVSGTLINSEAVGEGFDFYLIAQLSRRGTVKPTYYKVVYSNSPLEEGLIEELIYSQCFNYMNWSGSIKVPGVLQYAKKLGTFVGQQVNQPSVEEIKNMFYYI